MDARGCVNVIPVGAQWRVERDGEEISTFDTQAQAVEAGRREAQLARTDLQVFGYDGEVRQKDSYRS